MQDSNIDRDIEEIAQELEDEIEDRKKSSGFLTSKGVLWSAGEGHATFIGVSTMSLAYILPTPMGELFILMMLGFIRTGTKKWARGEELDGHLGDVTHEWAYTVTFAFLTAAVFEVYTGYSMSSIDVGQLVLAMVGGA